jgi:Fe-S cluster assembly iron-binding protein IscA
MLTLSPDAVQAINGLLSQPGVPEGAGLRMSPRSMPGEPAAIELTLAEGPTGTDQVVEEQNAQVFVDKELAPELDDKVLDAQLQEDQVAFTLTESPPGTG